MLDLASLGRAGRDLSRPESVLCTASGDIFASHKDGVAMHIAPDGRQRAIGRAPAGVGFVPNGLCLMPDGALLVANAGPDGGLWRLDVDERLDLVLAEADGVPLAAANFVHRDAHGRLWLSVSTRSEPRNDAYNRRVADGFVVLIDGRGARIVADGLAFANESRLTTDGRHLVVCETAGRRVSRFAVSPSGELGARVVLTDFAAGTFPDGCEFDAQGHLWVAGVVSNRLIRVAPDGAQDPVLEDSDPARVAEVDAALTAGTIGREHFYEDSGTRVRALTSIAFGGPDLRTIHLGSLVADHLVTARVAVAGRPPAHWHLRRPAPSGREKPA